MSVATDVSCRIVYVKYMYYVYVLKLDRVAHKQYYIGYTDNLKRRIKQHQTNQVFSTKSRNPKLIYFEAYTKKDIAITREKAIKSSGSVYTSLMKRIGEK